jgi:hypothetical protein
MLYLKYSESIRAYLEANVRRDLETLHGNALLARLNKRWADHEIMVKWMRAFFQYLDRFYVEMHSTTKLGDQGFKIFKEVVFQPLCENTTAAVVAEIRKQREGEELTDIELLKGAVTIFLTLSSGKLA